MILTGTRRNILMLCPNKTPWRRYLFFNTAKRKRKVTLRKTHGHEIINVILCTLCFGHPSRIGRIISCWGCLNQERIYLEINSFLKNQRRPWMLLYADKWDSELTNFWSDYTKQQEWTKNNQVQSWWVQRGLRFHEVR